MALPLPRVVSDVGPGGPLVTAMGGMNSLANDMILRKINSIKAQYMPLTTQAEAASKLAYANLMGPQFLAKLLGNDAAVANMGDDAARQALQKAVGAGMGQGSGINAFNQMQGGHPSGIGQPGTNALSGWIADKFKNVFGATPQKNGNALGGSASNPGQYNAPPGYSDAPVQRNNPAPRPPGGVSLEGEQWYNSKGEPVYGDETEPSMNLELTEGQRAARQPTWAENTGRLKGDIEEGKILGKHRADVINDIGEQQLQLSNTGANLDRIIDDINDPKFMSLRKDFPFYQDMQLNALSKVGTPEQQEMIGNFIADVKSFAGATVNQFKGNTMKREFDYADQLKPNENDTVNTARGKLTALKALKEIAERKNDIILDLMQDKHMNIGDAVKRANKMVDVKAIDREVKKLTSPMITLKDPKNPGITIRLPLWEARQRGVKNV